MMDEFVGLDQYADLLEKIDLWEWGQAKLLAIWIRRQFGPKSVIDIGCASGLYLVPLLKVGIEVLGIDGAPEAGSKLSKEQYTRFDLRNRYTPPHKFDVCLCLETAEHIEPQFADTFIETLVGSSDTIMFSAAKPGQGGVGHYNLQPQSYWLEKFSKWGFGLHPKHDAFRVFVEDNYHHYFHPWLINNGCLLGKI